MNTVRDILQKKGRQIYSVSPEAKVYEALEVMADKNIGALLILEGEKLVGVMSERDYARKVILRGKFSKDTLVREIMASEIICVDPNHTPEECMTLMTDKHIRHLPVLDEDNLAGVVSIGDVVKSIISHREQKIDQLEHYIRGSL